MAQSAVIGDGPVRFTGPSGQMTFIPLTDLHFDAGGVLTADPKWAALTGLPTFLAFLSQTGQLTPAATPPPRAAQVIAAAGPGAIYNGVSVEFKNVSGNDPATATYDVTVTKTSVYTVLSWDSASPQFVKTILGTDKADGSSPGLVHVLDADTPAQPKPIAGVAMTDNGASNPATLAVAGDPSGTAFNLEAFKKGSAGKLIAITIANVNAGAKTFDLTATWTKTLTGKKNSDLQGDAEMKFLIKVSDPPLPATPGVPRIGTVVLAGGADPQPAVPATTTVFTS